MKSKEFLKYLFEKDYSFKDLGSHFFFYNTKNGDIFRVKRSLILHFAKSLINRKFNDNDLTLRKCFEEKHQIIESEDKEKMPFHIQWHINDNCNLRCKHCYQSDYCDKGMSLNGMKRIVDIYFEAINKWKNSPEFSITGGEPLLNPHLFEILEYIKLKDPTTRIAILTNGTLLDKEKIKRFKKLNINQIQVSLEGSTREINDMIRGKGVYDKVINSIKLLKENNIRTSLHFVISRANKDDVENYICLAKDLNIDLLTFSNIVPFGNAVNMKEFVTSPAELKETYEKIDKIAKELDREKKLPWIRRTRPLWCMFDTEDPRRPVGGLCPVGISTITILSDGKVMPCRRFPLVLGDLTKQNFFEIWYGSDVLWDLRNQEKIEGCGKCKFKEKCGGCRGLAYVYFKDYLAVDPQCWLLNKELGDYHKK